METLLERDGVFSLGQLLPGDGSIWIGWLAEVEGKGHGDQEHEVLGIEQDLACDHFVSEYAEGSQAA